MISKKRYRSQQNTQTLVLRRRLGVFSKKRENTQKMLCNSQHNHEKNVKTYLQTKGDVI